MNERIKELAKQAASEYNDANGICIPDDFVEKFAELIIRECLGDHKERIALRYQGSDYDRAVGYGMEIVYYDIVEKFGVE
jgi:hypothetical protein